MRRAVVTGAAVGVAVSAACCVLESFTVNSGEPARAEGLGTSWLLFALGLPWSVALWPVGGALLSILHVGGATGVRVVLHSLPVASGALWGWLVGVGRAIRAGNRGYRRRHPRAHTRGGA